MLDQRLQASSAANMVMLAGLARARGFRLDDYGVVFDVEFPSMRRSMVWSHAAARAGQHGNAKQVKAAAPVPSIQPREIYLTEITNALVDAILDHGSADRCGRRRVAHGRGARERRRSAVRAGDPNDTAMTIILRIKGSDLNALRDRQLAREEARKRVEVKQY